MKFLEFPVRNYQFTVIAFMMFAALGITSWLAIPTGEDPPLDYPVFRIIAVLPGASPADIERLVVRDVEEHLDGLEEVESIESRIADGLATTIIEFEADQDADAKYDEVVREVNALRPELPRSSLA
jgi:multidrug efflux pump subunit AcrB